MDELGIVGIGHIGVSLRVYQARLLKLIHMNEI
jgi:hypothetical protein